MAAKPWNVVNLILPVGEKEYVIEPIGYRDGLTLLATHVKDPEKGLDLGDDGEVLYRHCMGPTWDEMLTDGCAYPVMERASLAAIQYQTALVQGTDCPTAVELAESVWENGLDPEALAAVLLAASQEKNPAPKPAAAAATSKTSPGTAAAAKTPRRASSSGTRSPKATPRSSSSAAPAKPRRSTGRPSSTAGRSS